MLEHEQIDVRSIAIRALGTVGALSEAPKLVKLLKHEDPHLRYEAVMALAEMRAKESLPGLIRLLDDEDMHVRRSAVVARWFVGGSDSVAEAVKVLGNPHADVQDRAMAAVILGQISAKNAVRNLMRSLNDPAPIIRLDAAVSLGRLGATEAANDLIGLLGDRHVMVRVGAAQGLCRMGRREGVKTILDNPGGPAFYLLNGVRSAEVWRKLRRTPLEEPVRGTVSEVLDALARRVGLEAVIEESAKAFQQDWVTVRSQWHPRTVLGALEEMREAVGAVGTEFILEGDRIRMVSRAIAQGNWRKWWQAKRKQGR